MKNVAVFYGGKSAEHDISIITALQVVNNLDKNKYNVVPVYIDRNNNWCILKEYNKIYNYTLSKPRCIKLATGFFGKNLVKKSVMFLKKYKKIDIAINCCHGLNGEDGSLAGLLQLSGIPIVGSGLISSAVCMDKVFMKDIFKSNNISCVDYTYFLDKDYQINEEEILQNAEEKLHYPIIVKPANLGSSIGINISKNREELQKNIKIALNFDKKIILEQCLTNYREINCSAMGNSNNVEISVLEEPKNWQEFLDFNEKYINSSDDKKTINVSVSEDVDNNIKEITKKLFNIFGCSGVVRIDYLLDESMKLYVNEINTIPGSYANYLWQDKYTFSQLLDKLIEYGDCEYLYGNIYKYAYKSDVLNNCSGSKNCKLSTK